MEKAMVDATKAGVQAKRSKTEIQAELRQINDVEFPLAVEVLVTKIREIAIEFDKKPAAVLEACTRALRTKKVVPIDTA
jgi:hypothetical protein